MTKFETRSDVGFQRVVAQLSRWVRELRENRELASEDIVGTF